MKNSGESLRLVHSLQRTHTNLAVYFDQRKRQNRRYAAATVAAHAPLRFQPIPSLPMPTFGYVEPQPGTDSHLKRVALAQKFRQEREKRESYFCHPKTGPKFDMVQTRKEVEVERSMFGPFPRINDTK